MWIGAPGIRGTSRKCPQRGTFGHRFDPAAQDSDCLVRPSWQIARINSVLQDFLFFDAALAQRGGDRRYFATDVAAASELILQEMETAVGLFEKLPK